MIARAISNILLTLLLPVIVVLLYATGKVIKGLYDFWKTRDL